MLVNSHRHFHSIDFIYKSVTENNTINTLDCCYKRRDEETRLTSASHQLQGNVTTVMYDCTNF